MIMCEGWIKISRSLQNHWLWDNAEYVKWWLDLLFLASWEDNKVLLGNSLQTIKRGSMVASIDFLCDRWAKRGRSGKVLKRPSTKRVLKFIQFLEKDGMILRDFGNYHYPMLTICNYASYQDVGNDSGNDNGNDSGNDSGNQLKNIKNIKNRITTNLITTSSSTARAREESLENEAVGNYPIDNEIEAMRREQIWRETICSLHRIEQASIDELLGKFRLQCLADGTTSHNSLNDAKQHFNAWLRIFKNKNYADFNDSRQDKRKGSILSNKRPKDYNGSF